VVDSTCMACKLFLGIFLPCLELLAQMLLIQIILVFSMCDRGNKVYASCVKSIFPIPVLRRPL
jgi:hypothetical protein